MLNNFFKFKWFCATKQRWVTDYISEDEEHPCVITISEEVNPEHITSSEKYSFFMCRRLAEDVYVFLEEMMNAIRRESNKNISIKIINIGINSKDDFVSGQFDIAVRDEE